MVRSEDPFWKDVEDMNDGRMECRFCGHSFAKDTSISRIKWHFSGVKRRGVKICKEVPQDVQDAARAAIDGRPKKKHKAIAGSSNNEVAISISTSGPEQNDEGRRVETAKQGEAFPLESLQDLMNNFTVQDIEFMLDELETTVLRREQVQQPEGGSSHERPLVDQADEPPEDSSEPTDLLCHGRYHDQPCSPTVNMVREETVEEEDVENSNERFGQPGAVASSSGAGDLLLTSSTKLVGRAFGENMNAIRSWLKNDEVSTIGIYGMGGVGKTTMLEHIYHELLQRPDISPHVYWMTMSQKGFSIERLQNLISKHLKLDLSSEVDDRSRAVKLADELKKKQKWILILDDLWNTFEPHKAGIPIQLKGCKLIMTTRSKTVCDQMNCHYKIKVIPLSEIEAWKLFMEELGHVSPEVKPIAEDVARECDGLPLGIITIAGSLRGVDDLHQWTSALERLKESKSILGQQDDLLPKLMISYNRLHDSALQQCLLYCALFPEDHEIEREELIGYLIDEGIIKGGSRQATFDEGHMMLNRLENVSLLKSVKRKDDSRRFVKMHDLIRDMAIRIQEEKAIVKAGAAVKELPDAEEWTENLTRVSLMHNQIKEIPSNHSPRCPRVSTLLLCYNKGLRYIADPFFGELHGLKVLDLSHTCIETLPGSVSDLVSLTALLLIGCNRLKHVPSLEKLRALKRLDLSGTTLKKVPQGMRCLTNLKYLRMNGCGEKEFPSGTLPKLSHLQVFVLEEWMPIHPVTDWRLCHIKIYAPVMVKGKEVGCLRKLEALECHFEGNSDFVEFLKSREQTQSLSTYKFFVGLFHEKYRWEIKNSSRRSKAVWLCNLSIKKDGDFQVMYPKDIQQLSIYECLCDVSTLIKYAAELEVIEIRNCESMESLVSSSGFCFAPLASLSYNGIFSVLKKFECYNCKSMKKLFPLVLLPYLVNLEEITVRECEKMEEIIGTRSNEEGIMDEESNSSSNSEFSLPKLRVLLLSKLPELKSIWSVKLICNSLKETSISHCRKLEKMPICLPFLENRQPSPIHSLEKIIVFDCEKMEEIVGTRSNEGNTEFSLPKLRNLFLYKLPELKRICSAKLICNSLEEITIMGCRKLERMPICLSFLENGQPSSLPSLEKIKVVDCEKMEEIIGTRSDEGNAEFSLSKLRNLCLGELPELKSICSAKLTCNSLEVIDIWDCRKLENMSICLPFLENGQPSPLPSLEKITVYECEKMKEIIGTRSDEGSSNTEFKLPKLRLLDLFELPELKNICGAKLICDSIEIIMVGNCQKLKRIPIHLPLLEDGQPSPPPSLKTITIQPKEWWESVVEWEHPNAKDVLRPFVQLF